MRYLLVVSLLGFIGCAPFKVAQRDRQDQDYRQSFVGKPVAYLIEATRIPDRELQLDKTKKMYEWLRCGGIDGNVGCSHLVAITKDGIIDLLEYR